MSEILDIDNLTGEIIISGDKQNFDAIKQTKIKAVNLLNANDFVLINGTWEAKRDGLIKILSSLPISYSWVIKDKVLTDTYSSITGELTVKTGTITRSSYCVGVCEMRELKGNKTIHIMTAISETRALKRSIEVLFGSVINYYVINYIKY